jgi:hypothetical protein
VWTSIYFGLKIKMQVRWSSPLIFFSIILFGIHRYKSPHRYKRDPCGCNIVPQWFWYQTALQLSTVSNHSRTLWSVVIIHRKIFNGSDNLQALNDTTKHNMFAWKN